MGVRDEGKKRLKGKHRALSFFPLHFFFFFTPPLLVPGCQAATMLSWPFFLVYREQCGTVTWRQERRGERFWRGLGESGGEGEKGGGQEGGQSKADLMRIFYLFFFLKSVKLFSP